jgi:hypothetical protein
LWEIVQSIDDRFLYGFEVGMTEDIKSYITEERTLQKCLIGTHSEWYCSGSTECHLAATCYTPVRVPGDGLVCRNGDVILGRGND